jgi:serine/threonine protein kinase
MSPEIFNNISCKGEADFWALGVIIYQIYARKLPFTGHDAEEIKRKIDNEIIDWEPVEKSNINPNLFCILKKLLIFDQEKRIDEIKTIKKNPFFDGI